MMYRNIIILFAFLSISLGACAQSDRQYIRQGNRLFHQEKYAQAEVEYRKSLAKNARNSQALYNLGCALMAQQKDSAAIEQLENAGKMEQNKIRKAKCYHNMGVICQRHQMYGEAIQAYEESLRNNPNDNETRYNLALCKRLQKKQNQNNNNQKNNNQKDKDKNKQSQKQQNQNQQDQQKQNQQQKPKEQMSKDNAEQLLNAAIQEEKATQQRLKKNMRQPQRRPLEKNW